MQFHKTSSTITTLVLVSLLMISQSGIAGATIKSKKDSTDALCSPNHSTFVFTRLLFQKEDQLSSQMECLQDFSEDSDSKYFNALTDDRWFRDNSKTLDSMSPLTARKWILNNDTKSHAPFTDAKEVPIDTLKGYISK